MNSNWESVFDRFQAGEPIASAELFNQFSDRLVELASQNIHPQLIKRFDGEDVVQSVFRTFFRRQNEGTLNICHSQQLWKLLVAITICKTRSLARRHTAEKRNALLDRNQQEESAFVDPQPTPEDALALWEEIDQAIQGLPPRTAEIISGRLEGKTQSEIAAEMNLSRQTIHRILKLVEQRLAQRFDTLSLAKE
ncbi:RNA polymerase sigma factor [Thalassoglobus neptunius]|uniref:RNA polymerase sigma factor n=1 Tax=Thalassoglobus neptunius TaxID=1938619 RepID=A0A5C5VPU5_9PLAN|nr:sigma-70 family RNA polymerase sigma factor [Thalassoglobus neptunius]TWT40053.1 RNA polymerase sigma factor [Thalassoglobus neptunius]